MSNNDNITLSLREDERQRCEVWTRVMGYHRPVTSFNPGKQSEHSERRHFAEHPATLIEQTALCDSASVA
ncbi:anaerobic ribonucleoside-triphosphate reductase [Candidatus Vondammii sp. HM_W22]|uniref:anaerobic ribonucleoside-triphosphate reductase n=1 Tax=Candidatus Vondammii sp. HM_W22 TaxID=2687299 RepID=UPI00403E04DD